MGESTELGRSFCSSKTGIILIGKRGWHQDGWKDAENGSTCGRRWCKKKVDLDEPTSFFDHVHWGCSKRACKPNEIIVEEYTKMYESRVSAGATEKLPGWEKPSRKNSCVVPRHGRTFEKMRWEILRAGTQKSWSSHTKFKVLAWRITTSRRKNLNQLENYHKYPHKLSWNACMVCQQTCKSSHKMDSGLRHTFGNIDFIHSSHKWLPTLFSCGQHSSTLSIGFISRLRLCWRPLGFNINLGWSLMYLWNPNICPH